MRYFNRAFAALAAAVVLAGTVQAADIPAYHGQIIDLGAVNGVAYYTVEKGGYRVVATLADANSNAVRFEAVLAPGQAVVLSSPAARGGMPARIEISRHDNRVRIQNAPVTN
jgi:hypothetical protein